MHEQKITFVDDNLIHAGFPLSSIILLVSEAKSSFLQTQSSVLENDVLVDFLDCGGQLHAEWF